jgi:hypothetical protein
LSLLHSPAQAAAAVPASCKHTSWQPRCPALLLQLLLRHAYSSSNRSSSSSSRRQGIQKYSPAARDKPPLRQQRQLVLLPPLIKLLFCETLLPHTPEHLPAQGVLGQCRLLLLLGAS